MEKHITKKLFAGVLALSAGIILSGCDPISAVPADYEEPIVTLKSGAEFDDNILGTLYDSIASDMNSKVVDKILDSIVEKQFGTYANYKDGSFKTKDFFKDATQHQIENFKKDVDSRLSEFFYNEITSGSYNDEDGQFSEEKMYNTHRQELYDLPKLADNFENKFYVTKDFKKDDAFASLKCDYTDYIEEKAFPEILKNKLVEDYIYRTNPLALGRSYARKISYVKIGYEAESHSKTRTMLKNYATKYIEAGSTLNFENLADAVKGFSKFDENGVDVIAKKGSVTDTLLNSVYGNDFWTVDSDINYLGQTLIPRGNYYKETKLGEIIESFQKAQKAENAGRFPTADDKAELDKFTGEGKTKEYGLLQKLISLAKEDYTTDGWFVKDGGASDLPSELRSRLFNIKTANELSKSTPENPLGNYERKAYLRNIKGNNFILSSDADTFENDPYNYIFDDNSSSFWLCIVEEAVSPSNFIESNDSYLGKDSDTNKLEDVSRQVAKVLGSKDNYIKEAYTEYINEFKDIIFYDSSLYNYFKSEFPDLDIFDED